MTISGFCQKLGLRVRDGLHYSRGSRELMGVFHYLRSRFSRGEVARLEELVACYRFSSNRRLRGRAVVEFRKHLSSSVWQREKVGWSRYRAQLADPALTRSVVLKAPGERGEKGVILVTFEYNWLRLLAGVPDMRALEREFDIIFSTSSSPSNYLMLGLALSLMEGPVYVQACNYGEIPEIEALHPRLKCVPMLPCDWIDPRFSSPLPRRDRDVDILMVAGWAPVKRQWQFFEALSRMPRDLRIVMIGQAEGRYDVNHARRQAALFKVPQAIEFHQSLAIEEVEKYQSRSRISVIFSRREGCCVAVTESFFADTPVGLIADAHIGPLAYINDATGVRIDRRGDIALQLLDFLGRADSFSARKWADEHISSRVSLRKLDDFMRTEAGLAGRPWTVGLVTPCWRPHPTVMYDPDSERLAGTYADLHHRFPRVFPQGLREASHR